MYRAPTLTVRSIPSGEARILRKYLKKQSRKRERSKSRSIIQKEFE